MTYVAKHRFARISARKVRLVLDSIRGKSASETLTILDGLPQRAAFLVNRVVKSAIANAVDIDDPDVESLVVTKAVADGGPTIHRFRPRAQGRATPIRKRTSHITVELEVVAVQAGKE